MRLGHFGWTLRRGVTAQAPRNSARIVTVATAALLAATLSASGFAAERPRPSASAPAAPAQTPAKTAGVVIAVLGDGYAEALTEGLQIDLSGQPGTTILQATHAPSGLADSSHYDWPKAAAELLAQKHVDYAVVMLGANDREALTDGAGSAEPLSPRWRALYAARVQALADVFRNAKVPLIWVGLPIVGDEAMSEEFSALNEITRDRTSAAGGTYVDTWNAFADENGHYAAFGPDAKGRRTRLRTEDGLDLTRAGAQKLAGFVEAELRARSKSAEPPAEAGDVVLTRQPDFDEPETFDVNAQIRREAGLPALPGATSGRVERGPVIALTAPAMAENGRLVAPVSGPAPLLGAVSTPAERALVEGLPIQPRAGRTDDFSWPRR